MATTMQAEKVIGVWRGSTRNLGFWLRTIVTLGLYVLLHWQHNSITLTTRRVTQKRGNFLTSNESSIVIENITDVNVNIGMLGSLLGYGDIAVQTSGSQDAEIRFVGLARPRALREAIFDLRDGKYDEQR